VLGVALLLPADVHYSGAYFLGLNSRNLDVVYVAKFRKAWYYISRDLARFFRGSESDRILLFGCNLLHFSSRPSLSVYTDQARTSFQMLNAANFTFKYNLSLNAPIPQVRSVFAHGSTLAAFTNLFLVLLLNR